MSAVASATGGALAVRDDDAYRRRLYRLADRRRRTLPPGPSSPGTVFLQLDGVGHDVLLGAVARGLMPTVAKLLGGDRPSHRLTPWRTDWSSQTGASQLGILHGSNHDIPAFRWYEKDTGEVMVCNRPTSAAELQRRSIEFTGDGGLLTVDGASRGNLFSGGADEQALVLSIATRRRNRENRSRAGYFAYFSDPANAVRTAMSFVAEVGREIGQSTRARLTKQRPRIKRGGLYPLVRAFATVVERDVVVAAVMGDMLAYRTAVYADLVAYDEVAHHSGPRSRDAVKVLQRLDRALALIENVAEHAPARTASSSSPTTARAPARPSRAATASPSATSCARAAGCPCRAGPAVPTAAPRPAPPSARHWAGRWRRATGSTASPAVTPSRSCWPPATSAWSPSLTCRTA